MWPKSKVNARAKKVSDIGLFVVYAPAQLAFGAQMGLGEK